LILSASPIVFGATRNWSGTVCSNWTNPANWQGHVAPLAGDDLVFDLACANNDFAPGTLFHSITMISTSTLTGNAIQLGGGGLSGGPCSTSFSIPTTLAADQQWSSFAFGGCATMGVS